MYNQIEEIEVNSSNDKISINNDYYFVTKYSKASEKEDRAEIFAELMILQYPPSYLTKGQSIRKKVDFILSTIKNNITIEDFYFTQFL